MHLALLVIQLQAAPSLWLYR